MRSFRSLVLLLSLTHLLTHPLTAPAQSFGGKLSLGGRVSVGGSPTNAVPFGYLIEGNSLASGLVGHQWSEDLRTNLIAHGISFLYITNLAASGDTLENMVTTFAAQVLANTATNDVVILEAGTNDIHPQGKTTDQVISYYTNFSALVRANGRRFIPIAILPRAIFSAGEAVIGLAVNNFMTNAANSTWAPLGVYDAYAEFSDPENGEDYSDGTHLVDDAERRAARSIYALIPK